MNVLGSPRGLLVVEVQYAGARWVPGDHWAFDAYRASGVYERLGTPVEYARPLAPNSAQADGEAVALGVIGGAIADAVTEGVRRGRAIAMVGGNCHHVTGVVGGVQAALGAGVRLGLVWLDAHGDINTPETTLSGSLGGMPLAVCAGLAFPEWRERSGIVAPLPIDRIVLADARNLDPPEEALVRAIGVPMAPLHGPAEGAFADLVHALGRRVDAIYLHIDADILDGAYMPNHVTREPNGPDMREVVDAVGAVMSTGKVIALALVSVFPTGPGGEVSVAAATELLGEGLALWRRHGMRVGFGTA